MLFISATPEDVNMLIPALEPASSSAASSNLTTRKNNENSVDDDIAKRLAALKGLEVLDTSQGRQQPKPDTRTEIEKVADLMDEATNFLNIQGPMTSDQAKVDGEDIESIEKRLAELRGVEYKPNNARDIPEQESSDEERDTDRIIQECLDEAKLDDLMNELEVDPGNPKFGKISGESDAKPKDMEELPFCEICNEDAVLRCMECENLFCRRCFREFHDEEEYKEHTTKPYKKPANVDI